MMNRKEPSEQCSFGEKGFRESSYLWIYESDVEYREQMLSFLKEGEKTLFVGGEEEISYLKDIARENHLSPSFIFSTVPGEVFCRFLLSLCK